MHTAVQATKLDDGIHEAYSPVSARQQHPGVASVIPPPGQLIQKSGPAQRLKSYHSQVDPIESQLDIVPAEHAPSEPVLHPPPRSP